MESKKNSLLKRAINVIKKPYRIFLYFAQKGFFKGMDDARYLKKYYRAIMGKKLNLDDPKTFNEKLQWLKIYDRNPLYTTMVDKKEVKRFVSNKIGIEHVIPTIGEWDRFDEIDFDCLPERFVLKCTHDSGGIVICKNRDAFDKHQAKEKIERSLKRNYYYSGREWPYKNVKPCIIAEEYIEDSISEDLTDYKFMCFNGEVKCSFVCSGRNTKEGLHVTFFDREWNLMDFERGYPRKQEGFPKPKLYEEMIALAEKLSENIPFVRVDFYQTDGKIYFGELTFYPGGGLESFSPSEWDCVFGEWIKLPEKRG